MGANHERANLMSTTQETTRAKAPVKVESGTYNLYRTPRGHLLEVFYVTEVSPSDPNPLHLSRWYYNPSDGSEPVGPYETEQAALECAY